MRLVQKDLRQVFARWGLPDAIRMDRDPIFVGSTRLEWPSTLILWLLGLGIQPIINRAYRPTDNAKVVRLPLEHFVGPGLPGCGMSQDRNEKPHCKH